MIEADPHSNSRIIPPPAEFHDWHGGRVKGTRRKYSDAVATLAIVAVFVGAFTGAVHYPASALASEMRPLIAEIGEVAHQLADRSTALSTEYAQRASAALANIHIAPDIGFSPRLQLAAAAETADSFASYVGSLWRQLFGAFSQIVATPEYVRTPGVTEPAIGSSTTTPTRAVGTTAVAPIQQTIINQPVIERILSAPVASGISQSSLTTQLALLRDDLLLRIASSLTGAAPSAQTNFQAFAASQRIDQLTGTSLTNITVSGVSGLTDADIPDGITAANYLPLIGGVVTGDVTLSGILTAGSLAVSAISSTGAILAPYFTATSTTASSTFPNLSATNATTTNATSTSLFSTLGRFTTGIFDTLLTAASASITNLTATTLSATNATTTRLDALEYVAVGGSATTTIRGDGVASTIPYASSTAVTVSGTASTSNLIASTGFTFKTVTGFLKASAGIVSEALVDLAANVTGILPVANGGTGWAAIQTGTIPYGNGSSAFATSSTLTFDGTKLVATYASTTALTSSGSAYFATSGGNVGIGTTAPGEKLQVSNVVNGAAANIALEGWSNSSRALKILTNTGSGGLLRWTVGATNVGGEPGSSVGSDFEIHRYEGAADLGTGLFIKRSTGNVGIGTTSPSAKLSVEGGNVLIDNAQAYQIRQSNGTAINALGMTSSNHLQLIAGAAGSVLLYPDGGNDGAGLAVINNGNVGIGTTTPGDILSVANSSGYEQFRVVNTASATSYLTVTGNTTTAGPIIGVTATAGADIGMTLKTKGQGTFTFTTNISQNKLTVGGVYTDTNYLAITSGATGANASITAAGSVDTNTGINIGGKGTGSIVLNGSTTGNVGIGNTNPTYKLDVSGLGHFTGLVDAANFVATSTSATSTFAGGITGPNNFVVQQTSGNVGIGTANPTSNLHLYGADSTSLTVESSGSSAYTTITIKNGTVSWAQQIQGNTGLLSFIDATNNKRPLQIESNGVTDSLRIAATGNVGIGTTTPWRKLSVTGTVGFDGLTGTTGAGSLCLDSNKQVVYNSGSDSCLSSTRITKHDITDLALSGISTVAALKSVSFIYNNDASSTVRYGFIAEDTAAVDPHFATYDAQGNVSGVDDRSLISILVKAVQEILAKIASFAESFTTKQLCVADDAGKTCISRSQLQGLLDGQPSPQTNDPTPPTTGDTTTPPSIHIAGDNPATIHVGDTYADLGAIATDSQGHELSYRAFLNGILAGDIVIDTSAAATDTIDYVATDTWGNTATSTRTVIVEAVAATVVATDANTSTSTISATSSPSGQ